MTIAERQGMSEGRNFDAKPTGSKTDFSVCLCIIGPAAAALISGLANGYNFANAVYYAEHPDLNLAMIEKGSMLLGGFFGLISGNGTRKGARDLATCQMTSVMATQAGKKLVTPVYSKTGRESAKGVVATTATQFEKSMLKTGNVAKESSAFKASRSNIKLDLDSLSQAGQIMDRGNLTKAGRALDKHGGHLGSCFPRATGTSITKNAQGQFHLDDILTDPNQVVIKEFKNSHIKVYAHDGRGACFRQNGSFRGFIERQYE